MEGGRVGKKKGDAVELELKRNKLVVTENKSEKRRHNIKI
jgi:hypothetical protein